jgi:putative membrane-bound dehydrogenase-like protein
VSEYETWDETYVHSDINEKGRILLAERVEGDHHEPWTWVREQGRGRVFYTASGHDERTWKNPEFLKMLRNAIIWSVGDKVKAEWEAFLASREPEKREANPNVANYEKRPEPITYQHPFSPKGSMQRIQVPADFKLELFASEPDITKPIAFSWDERGRLWVAETRDYPHDVSPDGKGSDSIKICEDTDGDGKADKFTVFADKLNIPTGFVFANGGIVVSQPPRFLFLKDTNGDDKADVREDIITGWGIGDTHGQAGNLHYGHDNWLYGSVGYDGFNGIVAGRPKQFTMGTYRFKADGSALEFLHQFTNNTWAHSANEAGDQFGGTANGAPIFFGGIPATAYPEGMKGMTAKKINVVNEAHAITPNYRQVDVMHGYTAACGSSFMNSKNLPERMQNKALVCEPTMKILAIMDVKPDGAGYKADDGMNLFASTDEFASPVYAEVGPDGAVWIADWQNFIIQHNPTPSPERGGYKAETGVGGAHKNDLRDHTLGRIYRIVWDKATKPAITTLKGATAAQLVSALNNDTQFWRLKAQQMLVERNTGFQPLGSAGVPHAQTTGNIPDAPTGDTPVPQLKTLVTANDGSIGAVHALWTLHGLGQLDEATHKSALYAKDARLRRNAIRALGSDDKALALYFGSGVMIDPDLTTRLAAFVKLGDFPTTKEIQTLVKKLAIDPATKKDEWLAEAAKMLARKHKAATYKEGPNLLPNPGLETLAADGFPEGWIRRDYNGNSVTKGAVWDVVSDPTMVHSGQHALRCVAKKPAQGNESADTSFFADVPLKPNTDYKLSAWIKTHAIKGKASMNDHINRPETEKITRDNKDWQQVEVIYNSRNATKASLNILFVGTGDAYFDDVKLCELVADEDPADKVIAGDAAKGRDIFWNHPIAACKNCHLLGGQGSAVGPPLDGIAGRKDEAYITQSLIEPNAVLAQGFEIMKISPMPPMGLILKPQEVADVKAFILTLKEQPKK